MMDAPHIKVLNNNWSIRLTHFGDDHLIDDMKKKIDMVINVMDGDKHI